MIVTRFAPSPTGRLHLGHAYSAILAHDLARTEAGRFVLRIDDIDGTRSRPEYVAAILDDLAWLGLEWDGAPVMQSSRQNLYADALRRLDAERLLYPCFCTRADIAAEQAAASSAPHGDFPPPYPGTCRALTVEQRAQRLAEPHSWRLDMAAALRRAGPLVWADADVGAVAANPGRAGDIILARKDAPSSYHLASTLDDAALGISHVVRGDDLYSSTHIHRLLQALLGLSVPVYRHHRLIAGKDGRRLAKRDAAADLAELRASGVDGPELAAMLRAGELPSGYSFLERA